MQNLQLDEGSDVLLTNALAISSGIYCRLQPETTDFLDLAADIGPKLLMETALRRYSVLSMNETIMIDYGGKRFFMRVLELKPTAVVSLCGDVDLEMDFTIPEQSDPKRPRSARDNPITDTHLSSLPSPSSASVTSMLTVINGEIQPLSGDEQGLWGYGRRLRDGGYVCESHRDRMHSLPTAADSITEAALTSAISGFRDKAQVKSATNKPSAGALRTAQQNILKLHSNQARHCLITSALADSTSANSSSLATQIRQAQAAFTTPGYVLGSQPPTTSASTTGDQPPKTHEVKSTPPPAQSCLVAHNEETQDASTRCPLCLTHISPSNLEIHTLRCIMNPSYHRMECLICKELILKAQVNQHVHCSECSSVFASASLLEIHQNEVHASIHPCAFCGKLFTAQSLKDHMQHQCSRAMEVCGLCGFKFMRQELQTHMERCASRTERCDICHSYVAITEYERHLSICSGVNEVSTVAKSSHPTVKTPTARMSSSSTTRDRILWSNQQEERVRGDTSEKTMLQCIYCFDQSFKDNAAMENHVRNDCQIAKAFVAEGCLSSQSDLPHVRTARQTNVIQGRIRRQADVKALQRLQGSSVAMMKNKEAQNNNRTTDNNDGAPSNNNERKKIQPMIKSRVQLPVEPEDDIAALLSIGNCTSISFPSSSSIQTQSLPARRIKGRTAITAIRPKGKLSKLPHQSHGL